tara:strand:+ start:183 stop:356 length:174 start_codon:yes stop_codon:yes gene_type:complete
MILETGTLVRGRKTFGIVMGSCKKRWAKDDDVWVMWHDELKPDIASCRFLEVLNESR